MDIIIRCEYQLLRFVHLHTALIKNENMFQADCSIGETVKRRQTGSAFCRHRLSMDLAVGLRLKRVGHVV